MTDAVPAVDEPTRRAPLRVNVITIFPEFFTAPLGLSIPSRARDAGAVEYRIVDLRDFTHDRHRTVDDAPYGGGAGMVLRVDVVDAALNAAYSDGREPSRVVLLAPSDVVRASDLPEELGGERAPSPDLYRGFGSLAEGIEAFERYFIRRVLGEERGVLADAARRLGIAEPVLMERIRALAL